MTQIVCLKTFREQRAALEPLASRGLTEEFAEKMSKVSDADIEELKEILTPSKRKKREREKLAGLRFYPGLNRWKASNVSLDPDTLQSWSYGWWVASRRFGNVLVVNSYRYSPSTGQHLSKIRQWMYLNAIDFVEFDAPRGLQDLDQAIRCYEISIEMLETAIAKPGTRKAKNEERRALIKKHRETISLIQSLKERAS